MSELTRLRDAVDTLAGRSLPPDFSSLKQRATRRRRVRVALAAGAAAVLVGSTVAVTSFEGDRRSAPIDAPSGPDEGTPEQIRDEGTLEGERLTTASGLTVRVYVVCDGGPCGPGRNPQPDSVDRALEVGKDGRSAVFEVGRGNIGIDELDDDSVLVVDSVGTAPDSPARYRVLQPDGTAVQLRMVDDPASPAPGPDVVVRDVGWRSGSGRDGLYLVDRAAATLRPLDLPPAVGGANGVRYWGPNVDEFLWGATDDCRVFWQTGDGTFSQRRLGCRAGAGFRFTNMSSDWFPDGWLEPGRMAVLENRDDGLILHVSLDHGATWQRIPASDESALPDTLRQLAATEE